MQIKSETRRNFVLVAVSGRVDSSNADRLTEALKKLTDARHYKIILDLSGLEYMSSAGLRALIVALRVCESHFGSLALAQPSARATALLELAGLNHRFQIYHTIAEAEAAL